MQLTAKAWTLATAADINLSHDISQYNIVLCAHVKEDKRVVYLQRLPTPYPSFSTWQHIRAVLNDVSIPGGVSETIFFNVQFYMCFTVRRYIVKRLWKIVQYFSSSAIPLIFSERLSIEYPSFLVSTIVANVIVGTNCFSWSSKIVHSEHGRALSCYTVFLSNFASSRSLLTYEKIAV